MGKKARLKAIKGMANRLPLINQCSTEVHVLKGSEILSWGTVTEIDGKPIDPDKEYNYRYPVMMIQNNRRMMKRAFLRNGADGVTNLLNSTINLMSNHLNPQS